MFGISAGTIAAGVSAAGSVAGAAAGAAGGGNGPTKNDRLWNDYQRLQSIPIMDQMKKIAMKDAKNVYKNPEAWAAYTGPRVADFSPDQQAAFDKARQIAGGDQWLTGAGNQVNRTLNGDYLNYQAPTNQYMGQQPSFGSLPSTNNQFIGSSPTANNQFIGNSPTANNQFIGGQPDVTNSFIGGQPDTSNGFIGKFANYTNPYEGNAPSTANAYQGTTTDKVYNPMLGQDNPYLNSAIQNSSNDTIRNYQRAIAPATDAAFARAGAFGGSAWGDQTADNQKNLATALGNIATNARMNDYQTQQGLQNQNAQFYTGVNQSDLSRNAGLAQSQLGMNQQNWATNAGLDQSAANLNQNTWQANLGALQAQNALASQNWQANLGAQQSQNSLASNNWQANLGAQQNQNTLASNNWQANLGAQQNQNALASENWQANLGAQQNQNTLANSQWATNAGLNQDAWKTNAQLAQNQLDNTLNNYQRERGYQQDAINNAMNLHNQGYTDANNLLQMGNQQQTQNQNLINAGMQQFYENQNSMKAPIQWYQGVLSNSLGAFNPSGVTPQGNSTNPYMGALGGAIGGYQLGSGIYNTGVNNGWWGGSSSSSSPGFSNASALNSGASPWSFGSQFGFGK